MKQKAWTITFETAKTRPRAPKKISLEEMGPLECFCTILFKNKYCHILMKTRSSDMVTFKKRTQKMIIANQAEELANLISWKYRIPLKNLKLREGNYYKIKPAKIKVASDQQYSNFVNFIFKEKTRDILEAYREIINEPSKPLRFIMYYRLIEVISKENSLTPERYLLTLFPNIYLIQEKRGSKVTIFTHKRGKIHATDNQYSFPYKEFPDDTLEEIDNLLRSILKKTHIIKNRFRG